MTWSIVFGWEALFSPASGLSTALWKLKCLSCCSGISSSSIQSGGFGLQTVLFFRTCLFLLLPLCCPVTLSGFHVTYAADYSDCVQQCLQLRVLLTTRSTMEQRYAVLVRVERGDRFNETRTWICFTPQAGVKVVTETFEFSWTVVHMFGAMRSCWTDLWTVLKLQKSLQVS